MHHNCLPATWLAAASVFPESATDVTFPRVLQYICNASNTFIYLKTTTSSTPNEAYANTLWNTNAEYHHILPEAPMISDDP